MIESTAAQISIGVYSFLIILVIIAMAINKSWASSSIFIIVTLPVFVLYLYDLQCVFEGQCIVWGWIKFIFFTIYLLIAIVACILVMAYSPSTTTTTTTTKATPATTTTKATATTKAKATATAKKEETNKVQFDKDGKPILPDALKAQSTR